MTRKHFTVIAAAIRMTVLQSASEAETIRIRYVASNVADAMKLDNPRFDRDKFMTACGL